MNKISLYKLFIIFIVFSPFLAYFSIRGIFIYGVLIFISSLIVFSEAIKPSFMLYRDWISVFSFMPYTLLASYYYLNNPYDGKILSTYFLTILFIPFFVFIFLRLSKYYPSEEFYNFILRIIIVFLIGQLIVCVGQITTYILGFGFRVSSEYMDSSMVTGTYFNSNDLAAIILILSYCFTRLEFTVKNNIRIIIWVVVFLLLIVTGSRSALTLTLMVFLLSRKINIINSLSISLFFIVSIFLTNFLFINTNNDVVGRIVSRLETLHNIYQNGINDDGSMNLRIESYIHFLKNFKNLGLGSGEINNYYKFSNNANFDSWLMFQNPHSLIVEIGYWLGWGGLLSFFLAFFFLAYQYQRSFIFIIVAIISMFISSSVLGSIIYIFFLILCIFLNSKVHIAKSNVYNRPLAKV